MAGFLSKLFGGGDSEEPEEGAAQTDATAGEAAADKTAPAPAVQAETAQERSVTETQPSGGDTQPRMQRITELDEDDAGDETMMLELPDPEQDGATAGRVNWLIGVGGDMVGKRFHIGDQTITIGRATSNYIQTSDAQASRTHCQLRAQGDTIVALDMNSSNGTLVNGEKMSEVVLSEGDTISIGAAAFTFRRSLDAATEQTDDGLASRVAGGVATDQTMGVQGLNSIIADTVKACDGDLEKAAQIIGCDVDFIQAMMNN
ncbi:MAG: FHA domain-containing protein [Myxococcota bacterium]|nr:FHA domain-containing protein [Myxococcota bacterium]